MFSLYSQRQMLQARYFMRIVMRFRFGIFIWQFSKEGKKSGDIMNNWGILCPSLNRLMDLTFTKKLFYRKKISRKDWRAVKIEQEDFLNCVNRIKLCLSQLNRCKTITSAGEVIPIDWVGNVQNVIDIDWRKIYLTEGIGIDIHEKRLNKF
jgi:hypothetical protein